MTPCKTPGCPNPRAPKRRICTVCRNRINGEIAKRRRYALRRVLPGVAGKQKVYGPCAPACPGWQDCTTGRLWIAGPLPCETLLEDEVGKEYEAGDLTLWRIPLQVSVRIEA
jgi:hypothetical protein